MSSWTNDTVPMELALLVLCPRCVLHMTKDFNVETLGAAASVCGIYFGTLDLFCPSGSIVFSVWIPDWDSV